MSANTGARKAKLRRGGDAPADEAGARADADPAGLAGPDAAPRLPAGLHLVATPIGNAADITLRALDVLARADALAAEDTRSLRRLMEIHGVALRGRPLLAYHDRNGDAARPAILARLEVGESVALVSDAGTPLIADPGYKLARDAARAGLPVTTAPGPSSVLAALSLAGLPTDRFLFAGFPPPRSAARRAFLAELAAIPATLVFLESPRRAAAALADMAQTLGAEREAALCRELTKRFEEVRRAPLGELAQALAGEDDPRGEVVLVVGPPAPAAGRPDDETLDAMLDDALGSMSLKDAVREVQAATGLPRKDVYARALARGR
ncbi:16S rRNA (cytidine(1402)-2'-O)-methyltransferase [uncultured Albimonas sp.]|uniref:16S rRNA (cytidine(1402)-2'-O)-methyltransferase n=1 Tax=uncultured Albimonas sp. TaxID=1331701 RepID=UPI0030EF2724